MIKQLLKHGTDVYYVYDPAGELVIRLNSKAKAERIDEYISALFRKINND